MEKGENIIDQGRSRFFEAVETNSDTLDVIIISCLVCDLIAEGDAIQITCLFLSETRCDLGPRGANKMGVGRDVSTFR
jgi:hypothetical protein